MSEILVVETLQASPNKYEELKLAVQKLVHRVEGALQYDFYEPLSKKDEILIIMRFKSVEDLRAHENSEYVASFVKECDGILYKGFTYSEWTR